MPFFTTAVAAVASFFAVSTAVASFAVSTALSLGLSYAAKALSGNSASAASAADHFSLQGKLQAGGAVARSFNLGYSATAGSLIYANTWGDANDAPNAYLTQAIALADLPSGQLAEIWINGELCTLGETTNELLGAPVLQYRKDGGDHLWIRYHDGTQTTADDLLVTRAASAERPYPATRVGHGVTYVVCTAYVDDTLFTGFPTFKFALTGIPLYDPSRDSSVGGDGSHRWSDPSTWGGDGDNLPAVQIYNLLRGIFYNGEWLYGLQSMAAARLPTSNWIAQINKCREPILGESGLEPTYRSGGQINVDAQTANAVEALLTACQGRISEIGGFYKIHLGAPDSPTFAWTDADILSTEEQTYKPFFGLSESINGITASYPYPAESWNTKVAPKYTKQELIDRDGGRVLLANPSFDFVPYSAQVQRLMRSALDEAQRARTHVLALPPPYWIAEPGDIGSWTSLRNGYLDKLFRVDAGTDKSNLDVILHVTEVDPADYDWNHNVDFQGLSTGPTSFPRPAPQGVRDWFAEGVSINDPTGLARRPAIRLSWDGSVAGVVGVQFEVRNSGDHVVILRGRTDQLAAGSLIISQSILPAVSYQVRGQYLPSAPRDMLWSDWLSVTTPDVRMSLADFETALRDLVTEQFRQGDAIIQGMVDELAALVMDIDAGNRIERKKQRDIIEYREEALSADIEVVQTIASSTQSVFASYQITVNAALGSLSASTTTNATSVANLNSAFSTYTITNNATVNGLSSTVTQTSTAVASINGRLSASYGVLLDVNGYMSGFQNINNGTNSAFRVNAELFQIAIPGVSGGSPRTVFQVGKVGGADTLTFRGDAFFDGVITGRHMSVGSITAQNGAIDALAVRSLNIGDNAVTVPVVQNGAPFTGNNDYQLANSVTVSLETLAGKPYTLYAIWNSAIDYTTTNATQEAVLQIDGDSGVRSRSNTPPYTTTVSNGRTYTGTGGVVSHTVNVLWFGETSIVCGSRSLCVWVVKR